jgi:hypothetical protein
MNTAAVAPVLAVRELIAAKLGVLLGLALAAFV